MRVGVTGKLVVKMNIPVAVRNATTHTSLFGVKWFIRLQNGTRRAGTHHTVFFCLILPEAASACALLCMYSTLPYPE